MQTIEKFMQSYFAERAELHRAQREVWDAFCADFFTHDYLTGLRESVDENVAYETSHPAVVISSKTRKGVTKVTTSEPQLNGHGRWRYYLRDTGAGWQIDRKGAECSSCSGTGDTTVLLAMGQIGGTCGCSVCGGLGWVYDCSGHT